MPAAVLWIYHLAGAHRSYPKSLNMGWCINCHVNGYKPVEGAKAAGIAITPAIEAMPIKKARYDCAVCHY